VEPFCGDRLSIHGADHRFFLRTEDDGRSISHYHQNTHGSTAFLSFG
jgi:hypothetical protein